MYNINLLILQETQLPLLTNNQGYIKTGPTDEAIFQLGHDPLSEDFYTPHPPDRKKFKQEMLAIWLQRNIKHHIFQNG